MIGGMKVKTSVTIDEAVLREVDKAVTRGRSRSRIIEDATRLYLAQRARVARDTRDLAILNAKAAELNEEMEDFLAYQGEV
jgi:metal-responsive CopG/Arc/MetJ family transcriptional regulator